MQSWYRRALVSVFALSLLLPSGPPTANAQRLPSASPQPDAAPVSAQQTSISGLLTIKYGDPQPGTRKPATEEIAVTDSAGRSVAIAIDANTRLTEPVYVLNGSQVSITGVATTRVAQQTGASEPIIQAQEVRRALGSRVSVAVTGTTKWATLLCRFPDDGVDTVAPYSVTTFFPPLIQGPAPSAEDYWSENSRGAVNFAGSTYRDWTPLPKTRAQYLALGSPDVYLDQLATDCAAAAGAGVDFSSYGGINVMLSKQLDPAANSAWGGLSAATIGGIARPSGWPVTWLPEFAYKNQNVVAHEMGHAFRLLHSSGPYTQTYDSKWDVMSDGGMCRKPDAKYGCLGDHTNAFHKDFLGWIPAERRFNYTGTAQTFTLSQTANPVTDPGVFWAAKIPIAGTTTQFYFVEARKFVGYDREAPFESVVIHKVDTARTDRLAQVVDPDNNNDPNDAAAAWIPGETYTDTANNFKVSVLGSTATGFQVSIGPVNGTTPPPATPTNSVKVQSRLVSTGRLEVSVDAIGTPSVPANVLRELRFGAASNGVVDLGTGAATFPGNQTIALAGTPARTTFFVNRVGPGPFIVHLEVADAVGTWKTFVGGGAGVP
jgi:M6 family metalloprotease-like protein